MLDSLLLCVGVFAGASMGDCACGRRRLRGGCCSSSSGKDRGRKNHGDLFPVQSDLGFASNHGGWLV